MDVELKCNVTQCRKKLAGQVYITSCSHIFCKICATACFQRSLVCPACKTSLPEASDIFLTDLHPSEEWKSMIASGLKPEMIMEISSRALSFWAYQVYQEQCYQELLLKNHDDKRQFSERQLQSFIHQAKTELASAKDKITNLTKQNETEKRKNMELSEQYSEKIRQIKKLQHACDKLKKKALNINGNPLNSSGSSDLLSVYGEDFKDNYLQNEIDKLYMRSSEDTLSERNAEKHPQLPAHLKFSEDIDLRHGGFTHFRPLSQSSNISTMRHPEDISVSIENGYHGSLSGAGVVPFNGNAQGKMYTPPHQKYPPTHFNKLPSKNRST